MERERELRRLVLLVIGVREVAVKCVGREAADDAAEDKGPVGDVVPAAVTLTVTDHGTGTASDGKHQSAPDKHGPYK